jgi:hypothetical protein
MFIHEVMVLKQKISNQRTLNERKASFNILPRPRSENAGPHNTLPVFRILEMLHKGQVISVPPYSPSNISRPANIECLETIISPTPSKNVNTSGPRQSVPI